MTIHMAYTNCNTDSNEEQSHFHYYFIVLLFNVRLPWKMVREFLLFKFYGLFILYRHQAACDTINRWIRRFHEDGRLQWRLLPFNNFTIASWWLTLIYWIRILNINNAINMNSIMNVSINWKAIRYIQLVLIHF